MSAPSFVAAALGEPAPSQIRVQRRTLYVARAGDVTSSHVLYVAWAGDVTSSHVLYVAWAGDVTSSHVLCGLAAPADDLASPRLVPPGTAGAGLVLAVADGTPRNPLTRRRDPVRAAAGLLRRLVVNKFGILFTVLLSVIVAGFALLMVRYSFTNAVYLTLMDLTGSALTGTTDSGTEKISQVLLTFDGLAFIPVVTAIIVGARLTGRVRAPRPPGGHVIVVGLGNVGTSVTGQLHDLGFDVVCIDNKPDALGIPMAQLGLPVVTGDAFREKTLCQASLDTCLELVSVTSSDIVHLETALNARALREDLRVVLRLADDDLAERLQKTIGNTVSRSVPYLALPAFAATSSPPATGWSSWPPGPA